MKELEDIVKQCLGNEKSAQVDLYNRLAPKLLAVCLRYLQDREEAEDAMQDAFVKVFMSLKSYKNTGSFEGWARRIAANTALSALKKKKRIQFERDLTIVETTEFTEEEEQQIDAKLLMKCLSELPDGYRTIINLFLMEEFSHKEIGEQLNITESTSRSQYARAKQALLKLVKIQQQKAGTKYA